MLPRTPTARTGSSSQRYDTPAASSVSAAASTPTTLLVSTVAGPVGEAPAAGHAAWASTSTGQCHR